VSEGGREGGREGEGREGGRGKAEPVPAGDDRGEAGTGPGDNAWIFK
jgi:hypothetical protein